MRSISLWIQVYVQYRLIDYIYTCICISFFPFPFERKTIFLWIWIYVQYQLIDYIYIYIFHFCLTYLTLCGVKHFCWKWNIFPIDWSNGPLLNVRSQKYQASLVWPAGQARPGQARPGQAQAAPWFLAWQARQLQLDQARPQARSGCKKVACWQLWW